MTNVMRDSRFRVESEITRRRGDAETLARLQPSTFNHEPSTFNLHLTHA